MVTIALLTLEIHIPHAQSLKDKRMVVRRLKDRLRSKFNVSVSETDHQDLWQRATIAVAAVGPDQHQLRRVMQAVATRVDAWGEVEVIDRDLRVWWPEDE